jgi:hypothetical protein
METRGEIAFARFLTERSISFEYEPSLTNCPKRPDFRIAWQGANCFFEVKDRENVDDDVLFPNIRELPDRGLPEVPPPYDWIRGKIRKARSKFGSLKGSPCALVLFPATGFSSDLEEPDFVVGSMYGDAAMRVGRDASHGIVCLKNGKMFEPGTRLPHNRTISALITLRMLDLAGARRRLVRRGETVVPRADSLRALGFEWSDEPQMGVIVWENVFATTALPADLFRGPLDERWGGNQQRVRCTHLGAAVAECHRAFAKAT